MIQIVMAIIFFGVIFVLGSLEPVYAATTTISDQISCEAIGGVWTAATSTCTLSNSLTIASGDTLIINSGITLEFAAGNNLKNKGSITNNGIIALTGNGSEFTGRINNENSSIFINTGVLNLTGSGGKRSGGFVNGDTATFTNDGIININGGSGPFSGFLKIIQSSTFSNTGSIIIQGNSGAFSGYIGVVNSGKFSNSGSITITGGSGTNSGMIDNWDAGSFSNAKTGTISITGNNGKNSGQIWNMGTSNFKNGGLLLITGGSGINTGTLQNSESAIFENSKTITITVGGPDSNSRIVTKDSSTFVNRGTITTDKNLENAASLTNFKIITIGNDLINQGKVINNCGGTITIIGILIGNAILESTKCFGGKHSHEDPTIGITSWGLQVVENGICINIQCWTVTANYHQDFELVEMLSDSVHTISITVYCHNGVSKCNYVAFGVSPYGTNINHSVWKIILQKDHIDNWTMTVIDPDGYLGDVTSTTQIVNDGKNLVASMTALFKKPTPGMILNVELRDSAGGYRDFKFNDGIAIKDAYAYPSIPTSYEEPVQVKPLCLNENPNKRYTCAFDLVRDWTIKNAEKKLEELNSR